MKLYELLDQLNELYELSETGEVPEEVINDTLEGLQGEVQVVAEEIAVTVTFTEYRPN